MATRQIAKKISGYLDEFFDLAGTTVRQLLDKIKKDKDNIYIVHSGADFTGDFNSSKIGTGEGRLTNAFRPMGDGLYGYVLDPNDVKEFDRAFEQSAKTYAENFGGRSHIFKIKKEDVKEQIPWTFKKNKLYGSEQDRNMKYDYAVERVGGDEIGGLTEIRVNPEKAIRVSEPQILTQDGKEFRKFDRYINKPSDTRGPAVDLDKFDNWIQKNKPKETYEYRGGEGRTGSGRPVISSKNNRFNKGGNVMAMEQQMEMFGANSMGGLDDDGMSRDPVSGNEIPPGSMANEVRDDVDAKLSDGEYVVPANVVRFFGVKFFEDLRNQAMQGLDAMEANGRIGGEPVPAEMPMQNQMAGAANELTEQDMAMLQGMMNEGGYVQGYNHGGLHDPITEKPIAQTFSSGTYPINQFLTPGSSTISSALNPYVVPSEPPMKVGPMPVDSAATVRYVTYEKPGSGEIRVIAFRGDTPVNPDEVTSALQAGYFPQGSGELANAKEQASRGPEDDWDITTGSKPPNKMTVGELAWSLTRTTYAAGNPKSFSAGVNKVFGAGLAGGVLKSLLGGIPSDAEIYIKTAQNRLKRNNYANDKEKAILEGIANQSGKDMGVVHNNMVGLTGINFKLGKEAGIDIPFNNKVPDYSKETKLTKKLDSRDSTGTKFTRYKSDDDGDLTFKGRQDLLDDVESKYNLELQSRLTPKELDNAIKSSAPTTVDSDFSNDNNNNENNNEITSGPSVGYTEPTSPKNTAGGRFMNKGGLLKKPTKKKTKK